MKKKRGKVKCGGDKFSITAGCGRGRKCDISLYITPQASTQEYFNEYTAERLETMKQDSIGDTIKNGGGSHG